MPQRSSEGTSSKVRCGTSGRRRVFCAARAAGVASTAGVAAFAGVAVVGFLIRRSLSSSLALLSLTLRLSLLLSRLTIIAVVPFARLAVIAIVPLVRLAIFTVEVGIGWTIAAVQLATVVLARVTASIGRLGVVVDRGIGCARSAPLPRSCPSIKIRCGRIDVTLRQLQLLDEQLGVVPEDPVVRREAGDG